MSDPRPRRRPWTVVSLGILCAALLVALGVVGYLALGPSRPGPAGSDTPTGAPSDPPPDPETQAQDQLTAHLQHCTAPADTIPAHCGIRLPWAADLRTPTEFRYRTERMPALTLSGDSFRATGGELVATAVGVDHNGAEASFTYRSAEWGVRGSVVATESGVITLVFW